MVDDEPEIKEIFAFFVDQAIEQLSVDIDFKFFHNTKSCLEFFDETKQANARERVFVVSDINMPETNGIDFMKELIHKHPSINPIFCTAYSSSAFQKTCHELGAFAFYAKPIDYESLIRKIIDMDGITSSVA